MSSRDELRAKAREFLQQAKAADVGSDSLMYLLRSMECDQEADRLDRPGLPDGRVIDAQDDGADRDNA